VDGLEFLVVVGMVFVNSVFAGYEIALASVSVSRLQLLASQRHLGAAAALQMKEEIEKSLAVVQLGITLVGLIAGATGGASATEDIAPSLEEFGFSVSAANVLAITFVVLPLTAVTIVVGELVPKLFALRNKEWVCLRLSPLMKLFALSVWPIVWVLETSASGFMSLSEKLWRPKPHSDARTEATELQELSAIASLARTSRLIGAREENIILGAARLASRKLKEIVLPVEHIRMLCADDSLADSLIKADLDMHTRFPVVESADDSQSIVGYVTFKDMISMVKLNPMLPSLRSILRQIPSLDENLPISEAMEKLLREHTHIALVRESNNRIAGMITLEDIVEEMIGDIQDEYDLLPSNILRTGKGWIIGGGTTLRRILDATTIPLETQTPTNSLNLSAWMIEKIGRVPRGGDSVVVGPNQVIVRKVRRQRVLEAKLMTSETELY